MQALGIINLKRVRTLLYTVRAKWYDIGVELEIHSGTLESIKRQYSDPKDCLNEMIKEWLKSINPRPTWKALADALKAEFVNEIALAEKALAEGWLVSL